MTIPVDNTQTKPITSNQLILSDNVKIGKVDWVYALGLFSYHLLALLVFVPWLFSWTGLVVCLFGFYVFGTLGINLCYHRLLTHRGFTCPRWLEHGLSILGVCCLQDTPARWVAVHRMHHQHSDEKEDPHSPVASFFWGHMGWLLTKNPELSRLSLIEHYAKDLLQDRFYLNLERRSMWIWINLGQWLFFYTAGFLIGWLSTGGLVAGIQMGLSLLVWGVFLRTVLVWHITWSVNSVTHLWGYRNYETNECSKNNILIGLVSNGEGWHNNHHADPRSAAHGHRWFEFDVTYNTVRILSWLGLAKNIIKPRIHKKDPSQSATDPRLDVA